MIRAFIAIDLPGEVKDSLKRTIKHLQANLPGNDFGWVRVAGAHLTLRFIGDVEEDRIDDVTDALRQSVQGTPPFELWIHGTGTFPPTRDARVLWAGLDGNVETLETLQKRIAEAVDGLGFAPEQRLFHPHLTLARIRGGLTDREAEALEHARASLSNQGNVRFTVTAVTLIRSVLHKFGATYTELARAELNG